VLRVVLAGGPHHGASAVLGEVMDAITDRIKHEPVLTLALIQAAVAMAVGFGLGWTGEQVALVTAFAAALLGFIARSRVTPT
jgi:hypothetical protein